MLTEYKETYRECADCISNWEELTPLELANKYDEYKTINPYLSESYLSAFILTQWNRIFYIYYHNKIKSISNCYELFIDSVLYVLDNHVWNNPNNSLYNDPDAIEKAMTIVMKWQNIKYYNKLNIPSEILNTTAISLDTYKIDFNEEHDRNRIDTNAISFDDFTVEGDWKIMIYSFFKKKNYFAAYLIDLLMMGYGFDKKSKSKYERGYNKKILKYALYHLDEDYCKYFAEEYKVDFIEVLDSMKYIFNLTQDRMDRNLVNTFKYLRKGIE